MDFSLTTLFVLPATVTLPTSGGPQALAPSQFGVYRNDYTVATTGNIAAAPYIYLKQGRHVDEPGLGTKGSDKIYSTAIIDKYKITANAGFSNQITDLTNFQMKYDTNYSVTLRIFSNYSGVGFYNGMTRSVTIMTPCLDCGDDPCSALDAADTQAAVDEFVAGINSDVLLSQFVIAQRTGSGSTSGIRITGLALPVPPARQNPGLNRHSFDRLYFFAWAYEGAETSQDPEMFYDTCAPVADVDVVQRALWPRGSSAEIKELEKQYFSYNTLHKQLFGDSDWNNTFESQVVNGTFYDFYYIKFRQGQQNISWQNEIHIDEAVILAIPSGQSAATETLLETFFGNFEDKSSANVSTTTAAVTTTTSTTSTTTLIP